MKKHIWRRGWRLSPLFDIGKYTFHFTNGIAFGKKYNCGDITYYLGWMILRKRTEYHLDFIKRINNKTWPKGWMWIVKYQKVRW